MLSFPVIHPQITVFVLIKCCHAGLVCRRGHGSIQLQHRLRFGGPIFCLTSRTGQIQSRFRKTQSGSVIGVECTSVTRASRFLSVVTTLRICFFPTQLFSYSGMSLFVDYGWVILNYAGLSAFPDSHVAYQGGAFQIAWYAPTPSIFSVDTCCYDFHLLLTIGCWLQCR